MNKTTYIILAILVVVVLWYAFGRKWVFIRGCENSASGIMSSPNARMASCEQKYEQFLSSPSVNWMPIAFN